MLTDDEKTVTIDHLATRAVRVAASPAGQPGVEGWAGGNAGMAFEWRRETGFVAKGGIRRVAEHRM